MDFQPLVKFKNYIYFEEKDDLRGGEANIKPTDGGKVSKIRFILSLGFMNFSMLQIIFYKNGVNQGVAFTNIYEGNYYAAISLYYGATVIEILDFIKSYKKFSYSYTRVA